MKNIMALCIAGLFIISAFGAIAQQSDIKTMNDNNKGNRVFTHTVFAEDGTATWCGYCHFAHQALKNIYVSGDYPFYYTTLVDDKNTHAAARILEYNLQGFPTVFFDGGNNVQVGGYSGNEADYRAAIVSTGARTVSNIDVSLNVNWLGDGTMDIEASVQNNEATQYNGRIRVYVTEIGSTLGWKDTTGHVYTFPFLDYAFNQAITINAGNTWTNSIEWDGHDYNDGNGHNFGNILYGNIEVIAVVFNSQLHQGYSDPPSGGPFDAYWVDDAVGVRVGDNTPPYVPNTPNPTNGSTNVDIHKQLSWAGGDANPFDTVSYDVYFGTTSPPPKVSSNQSGATYNPGTLNLLTTYYWKIVSWDNLGASGGGPIWQFTTRPNHAPNTPSNPSPKNGTTGVPINAQMSWTGGDQDSGDVVTYDVYFGTSSPPPKVSSNQSGTSYNPGTMPYSTKYYWNIIAWDNHGLSATGPIWQFTTGNLQNNAPNTPDISGQDQGKPGTIYTFIITTTDPDSDQVYYLIDWGDNTTTDWDGPHASGADVSLTHSWSTKNTYTVKVKAKDEHGAESDWGSLTIKIPTNQYIPHFTLMKLLQKLLVWFPLLERLLLH
jgi:glutaredoxin